MDTRPATPPEPNVGGVPAATPSGSLARKGAAPRGGKTVSKAQQKWGFANRMPWAHAAAREGAAYARLPEHKRRTRQRRG